MKAFKTFKGTVAPVDRSNVDTDAIIPKYFLNSIKRTGYGQYLFYEWRFNKDGSLNTQFELNKERYKNASILLSRSNFGCGSSREHAPWTIKEFGFHAIIASSFADIFYNNCFKNGILPIVLSEKQIDELFNNVKSIHNYNLEINLSEQIITDNNNKISFNIEEHRKKSLLLGMNDIDLTLKHEDAIALYEKSKKPTYNFMFN
ncbi:3-isopropylmalate dehydratase small subunit [Lysinibacillus sp. Bpr_S20]|uniref:3-isopropylmalate dehydratase small subunit n=1 Tax=Lysinibacillus sp. Bpr_S20 TaxID=2933964 RepID=UPI002012D254|nr:3-isopropylmalate dehydratase small subunit [Lysinibacillus sp. Bpr_S20]MCL1702968.1 3-isopropylmalate dehydratase small subunit [Lysinibacillus sp. Bpr_S20]